MLSPFGCVLDYCGSTEEPSTVDKLQLPVVEVGHQQAACVPRRQVQDWGGLASTDPYVQFWFTAVRFVSGLGHGDLELQTANQIRKPRLRAWPLALSACA
jgi:hypothetical protein